MLTSQQLIIDLLYAKDYIAQPIAQDNLQILSRLENIQTAFFISLQQINNNK